MDQALVDIARQVTQRWRTHAHYEDLVQVALLAAWQNRGRDEAHVVTCAKSAVIDELRRYCGRNGSKRRDMGRRQVPLHLVGVAVHPDRSDDIEPSVEYAVQGRREAFIADALWRGWAKRDIAEALGVHPSRVSQLIATMRARVKF